MFEEVDGDGSGAVVGAVSFALVPAVVDDEPLICSGFPDDGVVAGSFVAGVALQDASAVGPWA